MPFLRAFVADALRDKVVTVTVQQVVATARASGVHEWVGAFERKYGMV